MRIPAVSVAAATLLAAAAFAQSGAEPVARTLYFANLATPQGMQSSWNAIRAIAGVQNGAIDASTKSLGIAGPAGAVATAAWLFEKLDKPEGAAPTPAPAAEFRIAGAADDVVRVFYPAHMLSPVAIQEYINTVRSIADIQRIFPCGWAVALRGTGAQAGLAEWLLNNLDAPPEARKPASREYREVLPAPAAGVRSPSDTAGLTTVRISYPAIAATPLANQEAVNVLRAVTDIQRLFPYAYGNAIVWRAQPDRDALADWLLVQLQRPAGSAAAEFQLPGLSDGLAKVLALPATATAQAVTEAVNAVRSATGMQRAFPLVGQRALAVRGTASQVALAEQLLASRALPAKP